MNRQEETRLFVENDKIAIVVAGFGHAISAGKPSITIHGRTFGDAPSLDWLADAVKEKMSRTPDPDTGLVNCGCKGKAELWEQQTTAGVKHCVECEVCEISTSDYDTEQDAINAWNFAMGYHLSPGTQEGRRK